jgi:hypothetical protein
VRGVWLGEAANPTGTADLVIPFESAAAANISNVSLNLAH